MYSIYIIIFIVIIFTLLFKFFYLLFVKRINIFVLVQYHQNTIVFGYADHHFNAYKFHDFGIYHQYFIIEIKPHERAIIFFRIEVEESDIFGLLVRTAQHDEKLQIDEF